MSYTNPNAALAAKIAGLIPALWPGAYVAPEVAVIYANRLAGFGTAAIEAMFSRLKKNDGQAQVPSVDFMEEKLKAERDRNNNAAAAGGKIADDFYCEACGNVGHLHAISWWPFRNPRQLIDYQVPNNNPRAAFPNIAVIEIPCSCAVGAHFMTEFKLNIRERKDMATYALPGCWALVEKRDGKGNALRNKLGEAITDSVWLQPESVGGLYLTMNGIYVAQPSIMPQVRQLWATFIAGILTEAQKPENEQGFKYLDSFRNNINELADFVDAEKAVPASPVIRLATRDLKKENYRANAVLPGGGAVEYQAQELALGNEPAQRWAG